MSTSRSKSNWKLSEFVAHSSCVNCLALTPINGRMLATGGDDRRINLWLIGQPNNIMSISGMTSPVQSVAFNNSENWIGAGSKSGVFKVFDLEENKLVRSISGHKAAIHSLDFHRYGDILASGSMDTNLKLWDVRRKGCIFTYKGHTEVINSIQFSPDGKWVVSASDDGTAKIWDLSAGRMIHECKDHEGPVTSVQFHPKEFLMATGSADRTAKFWDLERFKLLSETPVASSGIRCLQFHPDGAVVFAGSQESLRVYGWEPVQSHEVLPIHWGKVADLGISGEQLIGATFSQTNVSLWCVDMKLICPFSVESSTHHGAPLSASGRRLFEYERQEFPSHPTTVMQRPYTQASSQQTPPPGVDERKVEAGGEESPPSQLKDDDRKELFAARQKLIRTPPKNFQPPFVPPDDSPPSVRENLLDRVQQVPTPLQPPPVQAGLENNQPIHVAKIHGELKPDPVVHQLVERQTPVAVQSQQNDLNRVRQADMIQEFMPRPPSKPKNDKSDQRRQPNVMKEISTNHTDVSQILKSRLDTLKSARSEWSMSEPKTALENVTNSGNQAALVDLLNVLHLKRTLWTLDMALIVLPELKLLLKSKYPTYVVCGCNIVKLVLKSFGPVIHSNIVAPPSRGGVDLIREERYEKCHTCYSHLKSLQEDILRLPRDSSAPSKVVREQGLLDAFAVLD